MILNEYVKYHGIGSHCATTILRTLTNAAGYNFSEAYCFGLGSGLGFTYQKYTGVDYYFFTGRNECLEESVVNILGGKIIKGTSDDNDRAWRQVCHFLDIGMPIILEVDMMKLPYIRNKLNLKREFHFGLHSLLLIGYDDENAYILDYMWWEPIKVPIIQLKEARNSQDAPIKPNNRWKVLFIKNNDLVNLSFVTKQAIRNNVHKYNEPYAFKMGMDGLKVFRREFDNWNSKMSIEELQNNFYMMSVLFEKVGTGGGNFRRMYGQFLDEANSILQMEELEKASSIYTKSFRQWRHFAKILDAAAEDDSFCKEELLNQADIIYKLEEQGIHYLKAV